MIFLMDGVFQNSIYTNGITGDFDSDLKYCQSASKVASDILVEGIEDTYTEDAYDYQVCLTDRNRPSHFLMDSDVDIAAWHQKWLASDDLKPEGAYGEFEILDSKKWESHQFSLLLHYKSFSGQREFPFVFHFNTLRKDYKLQIDDVVISLDEGCGLKSGEVWNQEFYLALYLMLMSPMDWMDPLVQEDLFESVEARMVAINDHPKFKVNQHSWALGPNRLAAQDAGGEEASFKESKRYKNYLYGRNPIQDTKVELQGLTKSHHLEWRSEKELTDVELEKFLSAMQSVPPEIVEILDKQGRLSGLKLEVMEDDVMQAAIGSALAMQVYDRNFIGFNHNFISNKPVKRIVPTAAHEFGHAIQPKGKDDFLQRYFKKVEAKSSQLFYPYVSPYARRSYLEMFAESVVAYLNGEVDVNPVRDSLRGPRSRAELREKTPEIYLGLKLYLEFEDNPFFGDPSVFSMTSFKVYEKIIGSDATDSHVEALGVDYSASDLGDLYTDLMAAQKP